MNIVGQNNFQHLTKQLLNENKSQLFDALSSRGTFLSNLVLHRIIDSY